MLRLLPQPHGFEGPWRSRGIPQAEVSAPSYGRPRRNTPNEDEARDRVLDQREGVSDAAYPAAGEGTPKKLGVTHALDCVTPASPRLRELPDGP